MPYGNRRGPLGLGPRSGRGLGYCSGYDSPGYTKPYPSMDNMMFREGFGCFGRGRGWRNMFYLTGLPGWARYTYPQPFELNDETEKELLTNQISLLEKEVETMRKRVEELSRENEPK